VTFQRSAAVKGFRKFLITGLGTGYLPLVPGTFGSVGMCAVFVLVAWASGGSMMWVTIALAVAVVVWSVVCVALGSFAESAFGRRDPAQCTADEWAGQAVALLAVPLGSAPADAWLACGVSLAVFRTLDTLKPPPVRRLEKLPSGWGILSDDLAAGLGANVVCQIVLRLGLAW